MLIETRILSLPRFLLCSVPFALACSTWPGAAPTQTPTPPGHARGTVFEDVDLDGSRDPDEPGLPGIRVSNGREVVMTDRDGRWTLPVDDDTAIFVIKPSDMRTAMDERNLPRFYYLHKPAGSPKHLGYPGVPPTGPLPDSIDFPLYPQRESSPFRVLMIGDPQPQSIAEVDHFARDILAELPDHDAAFGVTLGDIVDHDLALYDPLTQAVSLVGIPWYHVLGNHDMNLDARDDRTSDETFERVFGPSRYAFEYAHVHFIVLDDVDFRPAGSESDQAAGYRGGLDSMQLEFIEHYVASVPDDERIVLLMHIPLVGRDGHQVPQRGALLEILASHPLALSISAHSHMQGHFFLPMPGSNKDGASGATHHHWNSPTASGSWWRGRRDEVGIPHATMRDGSPNGYSIVTFDGAEYAIRFKPARRPAAYQMQIHAPSEVGVGREATIWANVFAGSERSTVELRIVGPDSGTASPWVSMRHTRERDPAYVRLRDREASALAPDEVALPFASDSTHLWKTSLPQNLAVGSHWIEVRSSDMFGRVDLGRRVIRIVRGTEED